MKQTTDSLERVGLTTEESAVYRALLELGEAGVSELARQSNLYRPAVYRALASLKGRELVVPSVFGRRQRYAAAPPEKLKRVADEHLRDFFSELPSLKDVYAHHTVRPLITFFHGKKGITEVYEDVVRTCKKGDVFYRYESPRNYEEYRKYVPQEYFDRIRDRAEVDRLIITNEITQKQKKQRLGRIVKVVPAKYDLFVYDISEFVYGDKVAFLDFNTETAWIIENALFARFQRQIFKLLFEKL